MFAKHYLKNTALKNTALKNTAVERPFGSWSFNRKYVLFYFMETHIQCINGSYLSLQLVVFYAECYL